jgi:hypothetical protein
MKEIFGYQAEHQYNTPEWEEMKPYSKDELKKRKEGLNFLKNKYLSLADSLRFDLESESDKTANPETAKMMFGILAQRVAKLIQLNEQLLKAYTEYILVLESELTTGNK